MTQHLDIISAPLVVETHYSGIELLAETLLTAGLAERLGVASIVTLPRADWTQRRDTVTRLISPEPVAAYLRKLADTVQASLLAGRFPLVLGGDCTIMLGCLLAQQRLGGGGLFFVDGHSDLIPPEQSPSGETADMDLALALGRGPKVLTDLDGNGPLINEERAVVFGYRDETPAQAFGSDDPKALGVEAIPLADIRTFGFGNSCGRALERLSASDDPFWLHVDTDVLDDAAMPAVDYRMPDGLAPGELVSVVRRALDSGRCQGMNLTIFNPTLDWDGSLTILMVDMLAAAFDGK